MAFGRFWGIFEVNAPDSQPPAMRIFFRDVEIASPMLDIIKLKIILREC
jgi:hypothetical protein